MKNKRPKRKKRELTTCCVGTWTLPLTICHKWRGRTPPEGSPWRASVWTAALHRWQGRGRCWPTSSTTDCPAPEPGPGTQKKKTKKTPQFNCVCVCIQKYFIYVYDVYSLVSSVFFFLKLWPVSLQWWWRTPWRSRGCSPSAGRARWPRTPVWPHGTESCFPGTSNAWKHAWKKEKRKTKKKIENQSLNQLTSHLTSHHWSTSLFVQTSPFTARRPEVCYSSLMLSLFSAVFVDYWLSLIYLNSITQVHHSIAGYSATWWTSASVCQE